MSASPPYYFNNYWSAVLFVCICFPFTLPQRAYVFIGGGCVFCCICVIFPLTVLIVGTTQRDTIVENFRYVLYDPQTNETTHGLAAMPKSHFNTFRSYRTFKIGKRYMTLSKFTSNEYRCAGTCFCVEEGVDDFEFERRTAISANKGLVMFVSAISIVLAITYSQREMQKACEDIFSSKCDEEHILSEVEFCEASKDDDFKYPCKEEEEDLGDLFPPHFEDLFKMKYDQWTRPDTVDEKEEKKKNLDTNTYRCVGNCMDNDDLNPLMHGTKFLKKNRKEVNCDAYHFEMELDMNVNGKQDVFMDFEEVFVYRFLDPFCRKTSNKVKDGVVGKVDIAICAGFQTVMEGRRVVNPSVKCDKIKGNFEGYREELQEEPKLTRKEKKKLWMEKQKMRDKKKMKGEREPKMPYEKHQKEAKKGWGVESDKILKKIKMKKKKGRGKISRKVVKKKKS